LNGAIFARVHLLAMVAAATTGAEVLLKHTVLSGRQQPASLMLLVSSNSSTLVAIQ